MVSLLPPERRRRHTLLKLTKHFNCFLGYGYKSWRFYSIFYVEATVAVKKDKVKGIAVSALLQTTARLVILPGSLHGHQVKFVLLWASFGTSIASRQILLVLDVEISTESH